MARTIAKGLRVTHLQNIKKRKTPDGPPYKPSKQHPIHGKKGRVRREIFAKLRTAKYMNARVTSDEAVVGFVGRVQRMVRAHQYGLSDRPYREVNK